MALVSALPLGSRLCLCRTLFGFCHGLKAIHRTIPNLGMCSGGRSLSTPSMSMSSTTSVSNDDGVPRRIGGHHSNLWDDDSIDSLSTSYEAPSYRERADRLVGEVKNIFNKMLEEDGELFSPLNDLHQRLWIVDSVERLGIDRHFKNEINSALDYVYRTLSGFCHGVKAIQRTIPNLGMCSGGRSITTPSMSMSSTTSVCNDDGVPRRIGGHHSNLWDDASIGTLSTSYEAPSYRERADRLIGEVKNIFNKMSEEDGELFSPLNDLHQRLWIVDSVERLGIDRHFKDEINSALDYVYSYWSEKGIGRGRECGVTDLNSTALGLRTLRLHGYTVSSDVLYHFKNEKGQFTCSAIQTEGDIRDVLNLFRASLIAFPGEKVMEEAEIFSKMLLKDALQKIPPSGVSQEIEYLLEFGWHTNLPRMETRMYIDVFGQDTIFETPYLIREKLLELAKLEFNIFHSLVKRELQSLTRWWKDYGFPQITFSRHRHVEYYTLAACIANDPKHSAFRLGFAKICHMITILDDIYDTFGTMEELELLSAAFKRWDPSSIECLPDYMKGVYMAVYDNVNEMALEAQKIQARDTVSYVRKSWEAFIDAYMQEARWISSGYLPTFEEYLENGKVSFGSRITTLEPMLTLGFPLPPRILQEIDFPSKFNDLICAILRLKGDTQCYKADRARGEEASSVSCYMKDHPGITEEDAVKQINAMVDNLTKELNWELLRPDSGVPISYKKVAFDICRVFHYGYKYRDGFSIASIEIKNLVTRTVVETVPL